MAVTLSVVGQDSRSPLNQVHFLSPRARALLDGKLLRISQEPKSTSEIIGYDRGYRSRSVLGRPLVAWRLEMIFDSERSVELKGLCIVSFLFGVAAQIAPYQP